MKTKAEKLKLAAQLLDQDKSYRVIAKRTNLSLNDISALKKQKFGEESSQVAPGADKRYTEAYKLFKQKKYKLIDVAIELGLDEKTTTKFWREYCHLENIDDLIRIYDNLGPGISSLLELYPPLKEPEIAYSYHIMYTFAHVYHMRQRKVLSENEWIGWLRWMKSAFQEGLIKEIWESHIEMEKWFDPAFQKFVDKELIPATKK
jgi:transcriptional regulator with XRE-family HTH domain